MSNTINNRKFAFSVHPDGRVDAMTMVPGNIHESILLHLVTDKTT